MTEPSVTPRPAKRRPPLSRDERVILVFALVGLLVAAGLVLASLLRMSHAG